MAKKIMRLEDYRRSNWSEKEVNNVQLLIDFVQKLMIDHDFDNVLEVFDNHHYKQHNRNIPDGMKSLVKYVSDFVKRYPDYTYDVKHIYADGDFIIFHSHITLKKEDRGLEKKGINVMDSWKVIDGQIVEHWDALQPMDGFMRFYFWLTGGQLKNNNGVF